MICRSGSSSPTSGVTCRMHVTTRVWCSLRAGASSWPCSPRTAHPTKPRRQLATPRASPTTISAATADAAQLFFEHSRPLALGLIATVGLSQTVLQDTLDAQIVVALLAAQRVLEHQPSQGEGGGDDRATGERMQPEVGVHAPGASLTRTDV